jgi:phosphoglycerate dehydrogenase-like enzyme
VFIRVHLWFKFSLPRRPTVNVLFHYTPGPDLAARLAAVPDLRITACPEDDDTLLMRLLPETDVLWHVLKRCTTEMIAAAPRLKLIQKIGVGVNTIDLDAAKARGIPVCNLPGTNARAVAELTLALMLATLRRVPRFDAGLRGGTWLDSALQDGIGELGGRVVGLVGYGAIPRLLAPVLVALGCTVIYATRRDVPDAVGARRPLDALLAEADVVSLHLPLTEETANLIDAAALERMKPGAILINTARGGLVDPVALAEALRAGRLAGAGLDVFAQEPADPGDPLLSLPSVVLTPHIAWLTTGTFDRSFSLAAENCRRLGAGEGLLHRVV